MINYMRDIQLCTLLLFIAYYVFFNHLFYFIFIYPLNSHLARFDVTVMNISDEED